MMKRNEEADEAELKDREDLEQIEDMPWVYGLSEDDVEEELSAEGE